MIIHETHEMLESPPQDLECANCLICTCHGAPELEDVCSAALVEYYRNRVRSA